MDNVKAAAYIRRFEGFSKLPYKCPTGHLTIGYGHNLERGISKEVAELLLMQDIEIALKQVKNVFQFWPKLTDARLFVLVDMCYNLGLTNLCGFKKMLAATEQGDYQTAAKEMLASKWAAQVDRRAVELSKIMEKGEW